MTQAIGVFFAGTALLLGFEGTAMHLNLAFWVSLAIAIGLWTWQYIRLCQPDLPAATYATLFKQNVWIGFLLLLGMILGTQPIF